MNAPSRLPETPLAESPLAVRGLSASCDGKPALLPGRPRPKDPTP